MLVQQKSIKGLYLKKIFEKNKINDAYSYIDETSKLGIVMFPLYYYFNECNVDNNIDECLINIKEINKDYKARDIIRKELELDYLFDLDTSKFINLNNGLILYKLYYNKDYYIYYSNTNYYKTYIKDNLKYKSPIIYKIEKKNFFSKQPIDIISDIITYFFNYIKENNKNNKIFYEKINKYLNNNINEKDIEYIYSIKSKDNFDSILCDSLLYYLSINIKFSMKRSVIFDTIDTAAFLDPLVTNNKKLKLEEIIKIYLNNIDDKYIELNHKINEISNVKPDNDIYNGNIYNVKFTNYGIMNNYKSKYSNIFYDYINLGINNIILKLLNYNEVFTGEFPMKKKNDYLILSKKKNMYKDKIEKFHKCMIYTLYVSNDIYYNNFNKKYDVNNFFFKNYIYSKIKYVKLDYSTQNNVIFNDSGIDNLFSKTKIESINKGTNNLYELNNYIYINLHRFLKKQISKIRNKQNINKDDFIKFTTLIILSIKKSYENVNEDYLYNIFMKFINQSIKNYKYFNHKQNFKFNFKNYYVRTFFGSFKIENNIPIYFINYIYFIITLINIYYIYLHILLFSASKKYDKENKKYKIFYYMNNTISKYDPLFFILDKFEIIRMFKFIEPYNNIIELMKKIQINSVYEIIHYDYFYEITNNSYKNIDKKINKMPDFNISFVNVNLDSICKYKNNNITDFYYNGTIDINNKLEILLYKYLICNSVIDNKFLIFNNEQNTNNEKNTEDIFKNSDNDIIYKHINLKNKIYDIIKRNINNLNSPNEYTKNIIIYILSDSKYICLSKNNLESYKLNDFIQILTMISINNTSFNNKLYIDINNINYNDKIYNYLIENINNINNINNKYISNNINEINIFNNYIENDILNVVDNCKFTDIQNKDILEILKKSKQIYEYDILNTDMKNILCRFAINNNNFNKIKLYKKKNKFNFNYTISIITSNEFIISSRIIIIKCDNNIIDTDNIEMYDFDNKKYKLLFDLFNYPFSFFIPKYVPYLLYRNEENNLFIIELFSNSCFYNYKKTIDFNYDPEKSKEDLYLKINISPSYVFPTNNIDIDIYKKICERHYHDYNYNFIINNNAIVYLPNRGSLSRFCNYSNNCSIYSNFISNITKIDNIILFIEHIESKTYNNKSTFTIREGSNNINFNINFFLIKGINNYGKKNFKQYIINIITLDKNIKILIKI